MNGSDNSEQRAAGNTLNGLSPPLKGGAAQLNHKLKRNAARYGYYKQYPHNTKLRGYASPMMLAELSLYNTVVWKDSCYVLNPTGESDE
ncbi:hypothetical protein A3207_00630 [Candidatus Methanomassiliicoccus intestinalis]|uniref:Uncharacterized protein n=2 Tax=Candidatus Methanomassiliicoccus intestinalis TaxID=1406512 RepID=R9T5U0_METII|nr:hypothetical protein [Candidatus Methanomassiliicoccus intestinalis]AGN26347.1 hypothetical protein MMINT_09990 [Candidatus Methanomassiliicoccus intestinalis Issoire-Mx1]TQS84581.1 MAG: hypothetical protein A3207_00630 [Candidatus Methanomassiliicoccus intestinalis]